jgi:phospholipid/cholesterol/gamma-HCH transport system permease protein
MPRGPATSPPAATARVSLAAPHADILLSGRLDASSLADLWSDVIDPLGDASVTHAHVDASGVTYCDGAGLGLLVEVHRLLSARVAKGERAVEYRGLSDELSRLLERATSSEPPRPAAPTLPVVERVGASTADVLRHLRALVEFLGETMAAFAWAARNPGRLRWADALIVAEKAGANAVPVVGLLGFLVGLIISFQSAAPLQRYAAESTIPMLLSISLVRELGPLFTAIILAGRSGSAFAAEIGTMKVTEEINALTTFGLEPVRFLVVPRVLAALLMTPLLSIVCTLAGLLGGYIIMASLGFPLSFYVNEVRRSVDYVDLLQGLFKAGVFAFIVAAIGCLQGLRTASGPGAVGDSTTRAVVAGIILIVVADGVLGVVFYQAGI